jgi:hypothetical protein
LQKDQQSGTNLDLDTYDQSPLGPPNFVMMILRVLAKFEEICNVCHQQLIDDLFWSFTRVVISELYLNINWKPER